MQKSLVKGSQNLYTSFLQIPPGATFQLAQYFNGSESSSAGRRLLQQMPQPQIISGNQVSVLLQRVNGYYYLTGGLAPLLNETSGKQFLSLVVRISMSRFCPGLQD